MKRIIFLLLSATLLLALLPAYHETAAPSETPERQLAALEVVNAILPVSGYDHQSGELEYLTAERDGTEYLAVYLENAYGLSEGAWQDAAVIRAIGASAFELAVLRLENEDKADRIAALLTLYLSNRQKDFAGYAPVQTNMVANGNIARSGPYVALCICPSPDQTTAVFTAAVNGNPQTTPGQTAASEHSAPTNTPCYPNRYRFTRPNKDDMSIYDTAAIRAAWEAGDPSSLSSYDKNIYNAAKSVLNRVLKNGMSDLEKETAVYNWMVNNISYDWTYQNVMRKTPRESFTPYGGLVNHTAVCLGCATTFQLLMDLAGVECITVVGASNYSREDHSWNMVRLNRNWYCVDVTWDASGREKDWKFFNITSGEMAETGHQWDYASVPEAVTTGNGRN